MGLDVSHDAWSGSYGRFNRFRSAICKQLGGRWPDNPFDPEIILPATLKNEKPALYEFLTHSDCDGDISPEICAKLAVELREIAPKLDGDYSDRAIQFAEGCERAVKANEPLEFM